MEKAVLDCSKRVLAGKKVRFLRRKGIIPANVYGHGIESTAVQCQDKDLEAIIKGGTARLIMLVVDGETEKRNVLIKNVDRHPLNRSLLHADFYQVKMTEKMTTEVPLVVIGHALALEHKENYLEHQLNELTIECLPDVLPPHIEVDVSGLKEAGQSIHVRDLKLASGIVILTPADHTVVRIMQSARAVEEVEKEEAQEGAVQEAAAETAGESQQE